MLLLLDHELPVPKRLAALTAGAAAAADGPEAVVVLPADGEIADRTAANVARVAAVAADAAVLLLLDVVVGRGVVRVCQREAEAAMPVCTGLLSLRA